MECTYKQQKLEAESRYFPPLYIGKSFFCYRDVNKAIDKHREIYGLRLALKRAVKLENYRLKIENMKDLNLRLKYGELDYHCFVATGRPGRPGNDERCHQLVRLRLSPDARCLIVYESHDHNITPYLEDQINENLNPAKYSAKIAGPLPNHTFCLKGDVTVTPILPEPAEIKKMLPGLPESTQIKAAERLSMVDSPSVISDNYLSKNLHSMSSLEAVTISSQNNFQSKTELERNYVTITPTSLTASTLLNATDTSADNPEKITLTIKKSECVPNEMVVVGSLRHVEEQKKSVSPCEMLSGKSLQQLQRAATTVVSILPRSNSPISTSPRITSPVSTSSSTNSANQLVVVGINCPVSLAANKTGPTRSLVNIAPKPPGGNGNKSPIVNAPKPQTNIKPNREILPKLKIAASISIVRDSSTINSMKQILPIKNAVNKSTPVIKNKHGETSEIAPEKHIFSAKPPEKINPPGDLLKTVVNMDLPAPKQPVKAKQVTVLKQSPNMKQVIINKPSPKGTLIGRPVLTKPHGHVNEKLQGIRRGSPILSSSNIKHTVTKPSHNVRSVVPSPKPVCANSPPVSINMSAIDAQPNKATEKITVAEKCVDKTILKPKSVIKNKDQPKVIIHRHQASPPPNVYQKYIVPNQLPANKLMNGPKKFKKKLGRPRPPDPSHFNGRSSSNIVDTELGYNEKQHIAHGVLLTLLKVTSHLPMVEFSDALETFEILTDAFRLNHKVSLSIKHEEEDDMCLNKYEYCNEEIKCEEKDFRVTSTTDDDTLAVTQMDGQFDNIEFLKQFTSFQEVSPISLKVIPTLEDDMQMEVEDDSHLQIENLVLQRASDSNENIDLYNPQINSKKPANETLKRKFSEIETSNSCRKRLK